MAESNQDFSEFCKAQDLSDDTIAKLNAGGFKTKEHLYLLEDDATMRELNLQLRERLQLKKVVQEVTAQRALTMVVPTKADEKQTDDEIRIVLFGITGSGKSAAGNTIIGTDKYSDVFKEQADCNQTTAMTRQCQSRSIKINGQTIRVIDTPGLLDPVRDEEEVKMELTRCLLMSSPGPHILLFVLNIKQRFSQDEFMAYDLLRKLFAADLNRYVAILFTHGDELEEGETLDVVLNNAIEGATQDVCLKDAIEGETQDVCLKDAIEGETQDVCLQNAIEGETLDVVLKNATENKQGNPNEMNTLKMVLRDVDERILLFDNKTSDTAKKDKQILKLLKLISTIRERNYPKPFFRDGKTEEAAKYMEKLIDEVIKEEPGISREVAWEEVQKVLNAAATDATTTTDVTTATTTTDATTMTVETTEKCTTDDTDERTTDIDKVAKIMACVAGGVVTLAALPLVLVPVSAGLVGVAAVTATGAVAAAAAGAGGITGVTVYKTAKEIKCSIM